MAETATSIATRERLWRIALALLPGLALVLLRGVDTNWDLRNYHLYNPHAWLTGRMWTDVAPAQLQSWHNPLLDVPLYLLVRSGWDLRWSSAWLTLPWAVSIYLLLGLQHALSPRPPTRTAQVVLALLAMSGATTWATLGNSMNDGFVAAALLGSLTMLLREEAPTPTKWLVAGLLAGGVMGLKLTASIYCLGLAAVAFLPGAPGGLRAAFTRALALGAGGVLGFLLTYGWWGWTLQQAFGNPFFPYFNDVFASPWAPARDFVDARFRASGLLDALAVPLQLLRDDTARSELYLRDPRLLFGALGFPALAWWSRRAQLYSRMATRRLAVFFWVALLVWAMQYGIYRYAALLELLGVLALVLWAARVPRWPATALLLALVLVSKATHRPDWGHARHVPPRYGLTSPRLPRDAMVLLASGEPLAYVALALPADMSMVALENNFMSANACSGLDMRAKRLVQAHHGTFWLLSANAATAGSDLRAISRKLGVESAGCPVSHASALGDVVFTPVVVRHPLGNCR